MKKPTHPTIEHGYLLKVDEISEKAHTPNLWEGVGLMSCHDGLHSILLGIRGFS